MINIVVFVVEGNSQSLRSAYFLTQENKRLPDHVVKRFKSSSLISCSQSCLQNAWCTSANFVMSSKNGKGTCELNKHERSLFDVNSNLHDQQGVIFTMILKENLPYDSETTKPPRRKKDFTAKFTCRDSMELFVDGISLGKDNGGWRTATDFVIPGNTKIIAVEAKSSHYHPGILGSFSNGLVTNSNWKCSERSHLRWNSPDFDDSSWPAAWEVQRHGDGPGGYIAGIDRTAKWIWTFRQRLGSCYCRLNLQ
ncbi:uncharacterized protein LOC110062175 [Orbicella faveolata]|uniref:uncharacterized protein LOC110062175 n=1 Tax=Orbicella faveolata TaxID=48498 RepID=UPI0009E310C5|nr:uncharacterized protein LOC110062175 [Orbicella faveolata]